MLEVPSEMEPNAGEPFLYPYQLKYGSVPVDVDPEVTVWVSKIGDPEPARAARIPVIRSRSR
jgi:hypothetical protein